MSVITSRQNPRIKALVRLRERRERDASNTFLIEGLRECQRALLAGIEFKALYFCPTNWRDEGSCQSLVDEAESKGTELIELSPEVFEKVSQREGPDGMLAVAEAKDCSLEALKLTEDALVLVVEQVEKPGNLGALIRTADGAGVAAVISADARADFFNPQVIRNSQGAVFSMACAVADTPTVIDFLKANGLRIAAMTPDTDALYWQADLRGGVAICVGNENSGLSDVFLDKADLKLCIPMHGGADSLNVSVSAALCLYEAVRQRRA